jgi:hypothetical protein
MLAKLKKLFCRHTDKTTRITVNDHCVSATTTCNNCEKYVKPDNPEMIASRCMALMNERKIGIIKRELLLGEW